MSRPRRPLSKTMLLPVDVASARDQSLSYHLALATCRRGHGNNYLFNELMRTVYVAWFLQQAGYGDEPLELYKFAEYSVEAALTLAHESGEWLLADDALPVLKSCWRYTTRNSPLRRCTRSSTPSGGSHGSFTELPVRPFQKESEPSRKPPVSMIAVVDCLRRNPA